MYTKIFNLFKIWSESSSLSQKDCHASAQQYKPSSLQLWINSESFPHSEINFLIRISCKSSADGQVTLEAAAPNCPALPSGAGICSLFLSDGKEHQLEGSNSRIREKNSCYGNEHQSTLELTSFSDLETWPYLAVVVTLFLLGRAEVDWCNIAQGCRKTPAVFVGFSCS